MPDTTTGPATAQATSLQAQRFTHAALPGRTLVRVVEETIAPAVDVEMNVLGFASAGERVSVGTAQRRALGFPTWALVHRPKEARFALEITRDLRKAAQRAKTKPGHARDAFAELATKLERTVPAFLPSFWEEVARCFVANGNPAFAMQSFEKARAAERAYELSINEDERSEAYLELALAGAVGDKALTRYADDLVAAYGAKEGERRFRELCVARVAGGLPPQGGLAKTLRKLASDAQRDPDAADEELLLAVIDSPALQRAPIDFWTSYQPVLRRVVAKHPAAKQRLVALFPKPRGPVKATKDFPATWLTFLQEIDAATVASAGPSPAAWLGRLTAFVSEEDWRDDGPPAPVPPAFFEMLETVAPAIRERGAPVDFDSNVDNAQYDAGGYLPDILEAALELSIPLADPRRLHEEDWSEEPSIKLDRPFTRDPARLAAHPVYGKLLDEAVGNMLGDADFDKSAAGKPTLAVVRARVLNERVAALAKGGLRTFAQQASSLRENVPSAIWKEFPEALARASASSAARALALSLQAGVLDELTWPAFEKALLSLKTKDDTRVAIHGTGRHLVLVCGLVAVVFDGATERRRYDLPKEAADDFEEALFLDDDLLFSFRDDEYDEHVCWASKPKEPVKQSLLPGDGTWDAPAPAGGTTMGGKPVHRGDFPKDRVGYLCVDDGARFWRVDQPRGGEGRIRLLELDPDKGSVGRASWPAFVEPVSERNDGLRITDVFLHAIPPGGERSLFGVHAGTIGAVTRFGKVDGKEVGEITRVDGATARRPVAIDALVDWPGADEPRPLADAGGWGRLANESFAFVDEAGEIVSAYGNGGWPSVGLSRLPPRPMLAYLTPRDEAGSRALRTITEEQAEALLVAARLDIPEDQDDGDDDDDDDDDDDTKAGAPMPKTEAALAKLLPALKDKTLRKSICEIVRAALSAERDIAGIGKGGDEDGDDDAGDDDDSEDDALEEALFVDLTDGYNSGTLSKDIVRTMAFFRGEAATSLTGSRHVWEACLPWLPKLLCFVASREATKASHRAVIRRVLAAMLEAQIFGRRFLVAEVSAKKGAALATKPKRAEAWLTEIDGRRLFVREVDDRDDDDEKTLGLTVMTPLSPEHGDWKPPADVTITKQQTLEVPDLAAFVQGFLTELDTRGPAVFEPSGVAALAESGGLRPADATLLLAGLPRGADRYANDFLGKELREKLGLKVNEAKSARETFSSLSHDVERSLFAVAFDVASPADFWALGSAEGSVARTITAAVQKVLGKRREVPEDFAKALGRDLSLSLEPHQIVELLFDESSPLMRPKPDQRFDERGDDQFFHGEVVQAFAYAIPWLAFEKPIGDELRDAVPAMYARLRKVLETPDLLLEGGYRWVDKKADREKLLAQLGGEIRQVPVKGGKTIAVHDNGAVLGHDDGDGSIDFAFRPAAALTHRKELAWLATSPDQSDDDDEDGSDEASAVLFLTSKECEALVADIAKSKAKAGSYTADPRVSAPATVKLVQKAHGLDEDGAVLYLQTLALPNPTQKAVCAWNVWTAARYKKAAEALTKVAGLVISGKRERAGREVFLPGAWIKIDGLPCEAWKEGLLGDDKQVNEPAGALFARAWARATGGDPPRFEETRKKAPKAGAAPVEEAAPAKAKGKGKTK